MTDYRRKSTATYRSASSGKRRKSSRKQNKFQKWINKNTSKLTLALTALIAVVLITLIAVVATTLSYDRVYDGIYLNDQSVSYMTKDELRSFIEEKYSKPISNISIDITSGDKNWRLDASSLHITFNIDAIVDSIYSHGHVGSIWERMTEIYNMRTNEMHINIFEGSENEEPLVNYDASIIDSLASEITNTAPTTVVQHQVLVADDQVSIVAGTNGYAYELETVKNALLLAVNEFQSMQLDIRTVAAVTPPDDLDLDATMTQINVAPVDATYTKVSAKEVAIAPEQYGLSVTRTDLEAVVAKLASNQGETLTVPSTKVAPAVFAADMTMPTYPDVLGEKTTKFSTSSSNKNRNVNLKVGTELINGYILLPGEQFSFNGHVNSTSTALGFKPANGYSGGKMKEMIGGGICQVSTTLYNAVIYSVNVDVNNRSSHSSTVSYVPKGLDCMINYGVTDFKFTNNTNYPIKIEGVFNSSGKLTFRILGVNEHKDISYEFVSIQTSVVEPTVSYTKDPAQVQSGWAGGKWTVERVTYQNGVEIKRETFSKSSYRAMNTVKLEETPTPEPTATPTPTPTAPVPTEPPIVGP